MSFVVQAEDAAFRRPSDSAHAVKRLRDEDLDLVVDGAPAEGTARDRFALPTAEGAEREVLAGKTDNVGQIVHADDASVLLHLLSSRTLGGLELLLQLHVLGVEMIFEQLYRAQLLVEAAELKPPTVAAHQRGLG
eukprot:CAMPEP_0171134472 /NCGR_PEP_ID=MMETSP0766_2-20121228/128057_1 /TAXON_ID=439317 /ORGANISM="Gambierdiscus australes, Strain CAWD 149" /LENGTH=134 /DNA_ID=CAMNT_0011597923 /DNA_START=147 /DNA_END=549 /DNA_ORIENTATION=+